MSHSLRLLAVSLIVLFFFVPVLSAQEHVTHQASFNFDQELQSKQIAFARKGKKKKSKKPTVNFAGIYTAQLRMEGRPKPIIKKGGNITLTCNGPQIINTQFVIGQLPNNKVTLLIGSAELRGKAKGNGFKAKGRAERSKLLVRGKQLNPVSRKIQFRQTDTVDNGLYCQYNYVAYFGPQ